MVLRFWKRATAIVRTPEEILLVKHFFPKGFGLPVEELRVAKKQQMLSKGNYLRKQD